MSVNARAKLWYGIVMSKKSLLKLADGILGDETSEYEDDEDEKLEYLKLEYLAKRVGGKSVYLFREGFDEDQNDEHGIAIFEKTVYDFDDTRKFKIPDVAGMEEKWKRIAKGLKTTKKPGWYLWTEYS